ncbi:MAG: hypothetical protein AB7F43_00245 [Bacteriovoracia bacterium]
MKKLVLITSLLATFTGCFLFNWDPKWVRIVKSELNSNYKYLNQDRFLREEDNFDLAILIKLERQAGKLDSDLQKQFRQRSEDIQCVLQIIDSALTRNQVFLALSTILPAHGLGLFSNKVSDDENDPSTDVRLSTSFRDFEKLVLNGGAFEKSRQTVQVPASCFPYLSQTETPATGEQENGIAEPEEFAEVVVPSEKAMELVDQIYKRMVDLNREFSENTKPEDKEMASKWQDGVKLMVVLYPALASQLGLAADDPYPLVQDLKTTYNAMSEVVLAHVEHPDEEHLKTIESLLAQEKAKLKKIREIAKEQDRAFRMFVGK